MPALNTFHRKILPLSLGLILVMGLLFSPHESSAAMQETGTQAKKTLNVISLGEGELAFFWSPAASLYTGGGWQIQDTNSRKIVASWTAVELAQGLSSFPAERQEKLQPFLDTLRTEKDQKKIDTQLAWLLMGAMADFEAAQKLGMGTVVSGLPKGNHSYTLTLLDTKNKPTKKQVSSTSINAWQASPLLSSVTNLRATSSANSIQLYWDSADDDSFPIPTIEIIRNGEDGKDISLNSDPLWNAQEEDQPAFIDNTAPLESELTYTVRGLDLFGRYTEPASVHVLNTDSDSLKPPAKIEVTPGANRATISWQLNDNPHTVSYVVERSRRANGMYEILTPQGVTRTTKTFTDKTVGGGFSYYYRVRSVGMRGEVGPAPDPVSVVIETSTKLKAPKKLQAEVSPTSIHLSWQPEPLPVRGYIVEKKTKQSDTWVRLNSSLITLSHFDEQINLGDFGERNYRIIAVSSDNQQSNASDEVTVKLPGHQTVPVPFLADIDSEQGEVQLRFKAAIPQDLTKRFLLVRGNSPRDLGMVIDTDIKGSATEYNDHRVKAGEDYWYALIAVDKNEHFSEMSNKLFIVVQSAKIPQPDRPEVKFEAKPFRRVVITFDQPEGHLLTSVMRKADQGQWTTVAKEIAGTDTIVDADPPLSGSIQYRVAYLDESMHWGQPSESTQLTFNKE